MFTLKGDEASSTHVNIVHDKDTYKQIYMPQWIICGIINKLDDVNLPII